MVRSMTLCERCFFGTEVENGELYCQLYGHEIPTDEQNDECDEYSE